MADAAGIKECKKAAVHVSRITGLKTGYGNAHFKAISLWGPFVRVDVAGSKQKTSVKDIIRARTAILKILEEFYKKHSPREAGTRLILRNIGIHGDFLIVSQNAELIPRLPPPMRAAATKRHKSELGEFAKFLRRNAPKSAFIFRRQ